MSQAETSEKNPLINDSGKIWTEVYSFFLISILPDLPSNFSAIRFQFWGP